MPSMFPSENNDPPEGSPKRSLLDIGLRLFVIFVTFFALSFMGTHFFGSKYHPTSDPMATGPSLVVATIVGLVMTICLARTV